MQRRHRLRPAVLKRAARMDAMQRGRTISAARPPIRYSPASLALVPLAEAEAGAGTGVLLTLLVILPLLPTHARDSRQEWLHGPGDGAVEEGGSGVPGAALAWRGTPLRGLCG